jgi:HlyD family secretion protein
MKKKNIIYLVIIICMVILAAFFLMRGGSKGPQYRTEKVTRGDIRSMVTATGAMNAVIMVNVGTQVSGTIKELYVDFNSPVKKGQVLALIDPATFQAQVDQARANLAMAKAQEEKSAASLLEARRALERGKTLYEKNYIAKSDLDVAETTEQGARAQLSSSKAQVMQARASLNFAEQNLQYTRITSPVDGIVISRDIDIGQTVAASFQTPTLFSIAQDLTKMQIDTSVDEADIGKVTEGQKVEFTIDAYPDETFTGIVSVIRNAPITVQNVVTYNVVITVDNQEGKLKPGMTANVSIILEERKNALSLPNAALRFRPTDRKEEMKRAKGVGVWIPDKKEPQRIEIGTGISDGRYTEIVSGPLTENQEVIVEASGGGNTGRPAGQQQSIPRFIR